MHPELLTVQEAAVYLHCHPETIKRLLRKGDLPGIKVGRRWLIPKAPLSAVLLSQLTTECHPRRDEVSL
jgi:excisionase family DNA binding protein